jgi:surface carbohydrate biosynthesis protein
MTNENFSLLIPVENQVRELDAKLLLACVAAERGYTSVIGPHRQIDFRIASFPRSIYLGKSFTVMNLKMFQIMYKLGHQIVAWDEEALVHLPPEMYFSRRLSPQTLEYTSHLLAWGEENAALWRQYPQLPQGTTIHITGNPRGDLLRPEIREFYKGEVEKILKNYDKFILVNTNFHHINAFYPSQNLFRPAKSGERSEFGKAGRGLSREYALSLQDHKMALFKKFQQLFPELESTFPDYTVVVRPHPSENQAIYQKIASECTRVKVITRANIVPWLLAAKAVIHNGCTTGVEAYLLGVPAISYHAVINEDIDNDFYRLPGQLSHQCFNFEQLRDTLGSILNGRLGVIDGERCQKVARHHIAAQDGPMACERIMDIVEKVSNDRFGSSKDFIRDFLGGWCQANLRRFVKWSKSFRKGTHAPSEFHSHRYPSISADQLRSRALRFRQVLGRHNSMKVEQVYDQIFRISK